MVKGAGKLLVVGGIALATLGMLYGLYYAVFVEHQMLDQMGGALATAFVNAAGGNMPEAHAAVGAYGVVKYDYVRQVDVHSHWIGLAMLMIVLGVVFDNVAFGERTRLWIAATLLVGSVVFPLGVILQTASHGGIFASALAVGGALLVIAGLGAVAVGFMRQSA
jgi:hypothetical protein